MHFILLLKLLIIVFYIGEDVCSSDPPILRISYFDYESFTVPPSYILYEHFKEVHNDVADTNWNNSVYNLFTFFVGEGDIVMDVFAGFGITLIPLAKLVGNTGVVIAIENRVEYVNVLRDNIADHGYAESIVLINMNPTCLSADYECLTSKLDSINHTLSDMTYTLLGSTCPKLMVFNINQINNGSKYDGGDVYYALLGSIALIERCQPVLYIDEDHASSFYYTLQLLGLLNDILKEQNRDTYMLYRYTQSIIDSNGNIILGQGGILAVPSSHHHRIDKAFMALHVLEQWSSLDGAFSLINDNNNCSINDGGNHIINDSSISVTVYFRDLASSHTYTPRLAELYHKHDRGDFRSTSNGSQLLILEESTTVNVDFDRIISLQVMQEHHSIFKRVAEAHCFTWLPTVLRVVDAFLSPPFSSHHSDEMSSYSAFTGIPSISSIIAMEYTRLVNKCVAFAAYRIHTVFKLIKNRIQLPTDADVVSVDDDVDRSVACHFYPSSQSGEHWTTNRVIDTWFARRPLESSHHDDDDLCGEPIWCSHGIEFQRRLHAWQFPDDHSNADDNARSTTTTTSHHTLRIGKRSCERSTILVFEPPSDMHGIGSMLQVVVAALRFALCLNRILILNDRHDQSKTLLKWIHPGCEGQSFLECYFEDIHGCDAWVNEDDIANASTSIDGYQFDERPYTEQRVLVLKGLPTGTASCILCYSDWSEETKFFDGLLDGLDVVDYPLSSSASSSSLPSNKKLIHMHAFRSASKLTWGSQMIRFLLRPRQWFIETMGQVVRYSMCVNEHAVDDDSVIAPHVPLIESFPRANFVSLHVRFGMKAAELELQPLSKYMRFVEHKFPHLRDVFVSTETQQVITSLVMTYPEYRFHSLSYNRHEYLDLGLQYSEPTWYEYTKDVDFVEEFIFSMANLYVASEAVAFVGTLSSNWCMLIMQMERTRGDGGYDYISVDSGSAFTQCF